MVVCEFLGRAGDVTVVNCHFHKVVDHTLSGVDVESLIVENGGRITFDDVFLHDGGIGPDGLVENALSLVKAHVNEVLSFNGDLGVSVVGTTNGSDGLNDGGLVVQEFC